MKPEYFLPILIVPWGWTFWRQVRALHRQDAFLRALYETHLDVWESLGRPCGWQWSAPGRWASPFSMFQFRYRWLREDPEWLERAPEFKPEFDEIRRNFREWNFRSMPINMASAAVFFLIVKWLEHP